MEKFKLQKPKEEEIPDQPKDAEKRLSGKMVGKRGEGFIELSDSKQGLEEEKKEEEKKREARERWEKKLKELQGLYSQMRVHLDKNPEFAKKAKKAKKEYEEFTYMIRALPKEFGKPQDYMAFHHFAGGTTDYENSQKDDLPGMYSVARFYQRCIDDDFPLQEWRNIDDL